MSDRIAVVGAGSMGVAWSIVFARAGFEVALFDPVADRLGEAQNEFHAIVSALVRRRLIASDIGALEDRLTTCGDLARAVDSATFVIECAPERVELKRTIFEELDRISPAGAILASSSSAIPISQVAGSFGGRDRCVVVHPLNPPFLLRVVEIVPAPFTSPETTRRARELLEYASMMPIIVGREIEGFLFNRLQGALLREAYCLVRDGVASVVDVDAAITEGLGMRWSVLGVFETVDLNTRGGIRSHAEKLGPAYARMGAERGQNDPWTPDLVDRVEGERRATLPLDQWQERVAWRDRRLMDVAAMRMSDAWNDRAEVSDHPIRERAR